MLTVLLQTSIPMKNGRIAPSWFQKVAATMRYLSISHINKYMHSYAQCLFSWRPFPEFLKVGSALPKDAWSRLSTRRNNKPGTERVQALTDISHYALCCHSIETHAPNANLTNSAQLEGTPYHSPIPPSYIRLCSSVGMRWGTDTQTAVTNIHFTAAVPHMKCNQLDYEILLELAFCRPDILSVTQSAASKHWREVKAPSPTKENASAGSDLFLMHQINWAKECRALYISIWPRPG